MLPTIHGLFSPQSSSAELTIDSVSVGTSSILVTNSPLNSTSTGTPSWTATDFTPDTFEWSFIDSGTQSGLVSRSFSNAFVANPTISVTGQAGKPANSITHEIQLVATESSSGASATATYTFISDHLVTVGMSTSSVTINTVRGPVGTTVDSEANMIVSIAQDVHDRLIADYGAYYVTYKDVGAYVTPPPRSVYADNTTTDYASGVEPYTPDPRATSVHQIHQAEIQSTDTSYNRTRQAFATDLAGNTLTINGYAIETFAYNQTFRYGPT